MGHITARSLKTVIAARIPPIQGEVCDLGAVSDVWSPV
jgi:hypothetical protein